MKAFNDSIMIDGLKLKIPFILPPHGEDVIMRPNENGTPRPVILRLSNDQGIVIYLEQLDVIYTEKKRGTCELLEKHTLFESLPSSYSGVAFKIVLHPTDPHATVKASPAKQLTGHNVFGTDNLALCANAILSTLIMHYPVLCEYLDFERVEVQSIDVTRSIRFETKQHIDAFTDTLKNVGSGQTVTGSNDFETTVYFGSKKSTRKVIKIYQKYEEIYAYLDSIKAKYKKSDPIRYENIINSHTQKIKDFAKNLLRFEAQLKKQLLKDSGYPLKLLDLIKLQKEKNSLMIDLWYRGFKDILNTFKGQSMTIRTDDDVLNLLCAKYSTVNPSGTISNAKAFRIYNYYTMIKNDGFNHFKKTVPRQTRSRILSELLEIGISRAFLQNLTKEKVSNIIPIYSYFDINNFVETPEDEKRHLYSI